MMDLELVLFENASATAVTSNVVEVTCPMFACFTGELTGSGTVTINLQDCDTATGSFTTVASMVVSAAAINTVVAMALPTKHKKFVKATVSASEVEGTMTGYFSDSYTAEPMVKPEGVEFIPTID